MARLALFVTAVAAFALVAAADAAAKSKRSETGPLIMSGTMVPPAQMSRRARSAADKCVPVTVKRPRLSLLPLR